MSFGPVDKKRAMYIISALNKAEWKELDMNDILAIYSGYEWLGSLVQGMDKPPVLDDTKKKKKSKKKVTKSGA